MTQFFSTQWTRVSAVAAHPSAGSLRQGTAGNAPPPAADKPATPPVAIVNGTPISRGQPSMIT